jgi:hypothetical protein
MGRWRGTFLGPTASLALSHLTPSLPHPHFVGLNQQCDTSSYEATRTYPYILQDYRSNKEIMCRSLYNQPESKEPNQATTVLVPIYYGVEAPNK